MSNPTLSQIVRKELCGRIKAQIANIEIDNLGYFQKEMVRDASEDIKGQAGRVAPIATLNDYLERMTILSFRYPRKRE